jgi:hypothetical protein
MNRLRFANSAKSVGAVARGLTAKSIHPPSGAPTAGQWSEDACGLLAACEHAKQEAQSRGDRYRGNGISAERVLGVPGGLDHFVLGAA